MLVKEVNPVYLHPASSCSFQLLGSAIKQLL